MSTYDYAVLEVIRVVDGDTVDLRIDLGFHLTAALRFRILGLNTPERGEYAWGDATLITRDWLTVDAPTLRVRTQKADSFGRWLGDVYTLDRGGDTLTNHVIRTMQAEYGIDCRWKG